MKKNYLKLICVLFAFGVSYANAQSLQKRSFFKNNPDLGGEVTITSSSVKVIDDESYVDFEVESDGNGEFYADFWLAPSRIGENTYTTYKVYVNEKLAGTITPTSGNWQSISLSENKKLKMNKGSNTISVVAPLPEVTSVEFVKLGKVKEKARIHSEYYEKFYAEAKANNERIKATAKNARFSVNELDSTSLPALRSSGGYQTTTAYVNYTHYRIEYYQAGFGQRWRSNSNIRHYLEIFSEDPSIFSETVMSMTPNSSGQYVNEISFTVPRSGYYYVRTRSYTQLQSGLVSLATGQALTFWQDNLPIYSYGFAITQGGNNNYYASFTKNPAPTDPFIFIQEAGTNKIVAYNDDHVPSGYSSKYGLTKLDSYVRAKYAKTTTAVLVTSAESYRTPGTCTLYAKVLDSDNVPIIRTNSLLYSGVENGTTDNDILSEKDFLVYPNPVTVNSTLNINSDDKVNQIAIYDLSGRLVCTKTLNSNSENLSLPNLNINSPGIYIINIYTDQGVKSQKLFVK